MIINSILNLIDNTTKNTQDIFNNINKLEDEIAKLNLSDNENKIFNNIFSNLNILMQNEDLHIQEMETIIYDIASKDKIDISKYNLASKPENIYKTSETLTNEEIQRLLNTNCLISE